MENYSLILKINELQKQIDELRMEIERLKQPAYPMPTYPVWPCPTYPAWNPNQIWCENSYNIALVEKNK